VLLAIVQACYAQTGAILRRLEERVAAMERLESA
jgi:hypothetical protein